MHRAYITNVVNSACVRQKAMLTRNYITNWSSISFMFSLPISIQATFVITTSERQVINREETSLEEKYVLWITNSCRYFRDAAASLLASTDRPTDRPVDACCYQYTLCTNEDCYQNVDVLDMFIYWSLM